MWSNDINNERTVIGKKKERGEEKRKEKKEKEKEMKESKKEVGWNVVLLEFYTIYWYCWSLQNWKYQPQLSEQIISHLRLI